MCGCMCLGRCVSVCGGGWAVGGGGADDVEVTLCEVKKKAHIKTWKHI